jgi:hypothetical protein
LSAYIDFKNKKYHQALLKFIWNDQFVPALSHVMEYDRDNLSDYKLKASYALAYIAISASETEKEDLLESMLQAIDEYYIDEKELFDFKLAESAYKRSS